ncbi:actin-like [Latimeria chalumnae]|uniref:actin-like n=1 Tax=Latimeria chalumnae TaxID=7897 RepID=UPI00313E512D
MVTAKEEAKENEETSAQEPTSHIAGKHYDSYTRILKTGAIVIDMGTGSCKAGFAGQALPSSVVESIVGYPSRKTRKGLKGALFGKLARKHFNNIIEAVQHGVIVDWEAAVSLWQHMCFHDLKASPAEHAILVSDPPLSPTTNREKMAEVLFEDMNAASMYIAYQSILATYSYGKTTGLVVDSGYSFTHTVPVYEGYNMPHAIRRMDFGGFDLTTYLMKLLEKYVDMDDTKRHIIEDMKIKCCYVAADAKRESNLSPVEYEADYELPDGLIITLNKERFTCPEALFVPSLAGSSQNGIHTMTMESLMKVPASSQKAMFSNILLSGGSTMFDGFSDRLDKELLNISEKDLVPTVFSNPNRSYTVWTGGSILASLQSFQTLWVQNSDYKENGPCIVHRMCY